MKVSFTANANAELKSIARFIAKDNISRAKSFSKELRQACTQLGEHPERFARAFGYNDIRKRPYGNFVIFYRISDQSIDILHIYHGAMDINNSDLDA